MIDLRLDGFQPALRVPIESAPAATLAFLFLLLSIFSLTFKPSFSVLTTRITLSAVSCYWFYRFGHTFQAPSRAVESGVSIIFGYGTFRNIEVSLVYLLEPLPRWVRNGVPQKMPESYVARMIWSLDLLFSMRGTSYLPDTYWDFATPALINPKHKKSRGTFLREQAISLVQQVFLMDIIDSSIKSQAWPTMPLSIHPITTLSLPYQLYFAICVCIQTALSMSTPYAALSMAAVALGSRPESWPPLYDDPFGATSLQAFWTHKWHAGFRRVFLLLSTGLVDLSKRFIRNRRAQVAFRGFCVFSMSCILHLALMYRIRPVDFPPSRVTFFEGETLLFFLMQPFGMLLEVVLVRPLAKYAFGEGDRRAVLWCNRAFAWIWLLWTGRYWSDVWVRHGMWGSDERWVGYSLVRGLLRGELVQ